MGTPANRLQIGSDPASDVADPDYDVTSLQVSQDKDYWYLGFHVPAAPSKNVTYGLYLDLDHLDEFWRDQRCTRLYRYHHSSLSAGICHLCTSGSGAVSCASKVYIYHWNGSGWDTGNVSWNNWWAIDPPILSGDYVEIKIPNTAIGYQDTTGSYAISLFSLPAGSGQPQDSVPSDPNVPGTGAISRFSNVSERMNLVMPPNDAGVDPSTYPSILPFFWDWSILTPHAGAYMKAYLDPLFTNQVATYTLTQTSWHELCHDIPCLGG